MNCPGLDIVSLQLNWGGWDGGCVCCRSWKILAYQSAFHPVAGQSGRWRIWQVAFQDPNMLKHVKTRVRVQSRNRFRFWIWFVGNVAPVFQNQLMRMVAAFASQGPAAKETIGKVRQNQCNLWFLFRIQLSAADDSLDWHRFRVKKRLFRNGHEFFWNALLNQLFLSSLTAVDQFHSYDNIIPNILYVCDFLIWCFFFFSLGSNYWKLLIYSQMGIIDKIVRFQILETLIQGLRIFLHLARNSINSPKFQYWFCVNYLFNNLWKNNPYYLFLINLDHIPSQDTPTRTEALQRSILMCILKTSQNILLNFK